MSLPPDMICAKCPKSTHLLARFWRNFVSPMDGLRQIGGVKPPYLALTIILRRRFSSFLARFSPSFVSFQRLGFGALLARFWRTLLGRRVSGITVVKCSSVAAGAHRRLCLTI